MTVEVGDYEYTGENTWCPGCGNFAILRSLKQALVLVGLAPHEVLVVSGVGQAAKLPQYLNCNAYTVLHGRTLPAAVGAKLANHKLTVVAVGGDGDGLAEGGNHFIHNMRRNADVTYLLNNNQVYGLTKGQPSPTSDPGFASKMSPKGSVHPHMQPAALGVACDCTFVSRGFAGQPDHLTQLIAQGIRHKGFALIEILQPCISYNDINTYEWYRQRAKALPAEYDPTDRGAAFSKALEWGDTIPIGVIYTSGRPSLEGRIPALRKGPLVDQPIDPEVGMKLLAEFS